MSRRRDTPNAVAVEALKGFDDYELRLGDIMRGERATMGKSLLDVQRDLKIKATYIAAIENADPTAFESPGFVAGYVRSYARYLGLDPEWAYQTFCDEGNFNYQGGLSSQKSSARAAKASGAGAAPSGLRDPFKQPSVTFIPAGEGRLSGLEPSAIGSIAVLAVLVAAIGYGGWSVLQEVQKVQFTPVDETPGVLSQLDPVVASPEPEAEGGASGIASLGAPSQDAFDRLYRPQALDVPVLVAGDSPIATIEPGSIGALSPETAAPQVREVAAGPRVTLAPVDQAVAEALGEAAGEAVAGAPDAADATETAAPGVQVVAAGPPAVALFAVRPSWVRVRAADGTIVFEKILDAGERFDLPQTEEPHTLRAGNAGSVYFAVGDQTFGPAGSGATVIDNVVLSAEALPEAYALADPEADSDLARFVAVAEAQGE